MKAEIGPAVTLMILGGGAAAVLAAARQRNAMVWFFVGTLFPILAAALLWCTPPASRVQHAEVT